jgi:hypothetical protein
VKNLKNVHRLDLSGCNLISDEGFTEYENCSENSRIIGTMQCPNVTDECKYMLRKKLKLLCFVVIAFINE